MTIEVKIIGFADDLTDVKEKERIQVSRKL